MNLYDQSGQQGFMPNTAGDYGARAYLLYSGNHIGVETSSGAAVAFDYQDSPDYQKMLKVTTAPQSVPLPDISFDYIDPALLKKGQDAVAKEKVQVEKEMATYQAAQNKMNNIKKYFL